MSVFTFRHSNYLFWLKIAHVLKPSPLSMSTCGRPAMNTFRLFLGIVFKYCIPCFFFSKCFIIFFDKGYNGIRIAGAFFSYEFLGVRTYSNLVFQILYP